jgi:predicted O-methyltransferase YrrM
VSAAEETAELPYARAIRLDGAMTEAELAVLYDTARTMPAGAVVVEVGSFKGRSSVATCEGLRGVSDARFFAVDPWLRTSMLTLGTYSAEDPERDTIYERFLRNTAPYPFVTALRTTSVDAAAQFEDDSIDWVFIDGDHRFSAVRADLGAWWPKVRSGGLVTGHDYSWLSVRLAVASHLAHVELPGGDIWQTRKTSETLPVRPFALAAGALQMTARNAARRILRRV